MMEFRSESILGLKEFLGKCSAKRGFLNLDISYNYIRDEGLSLLEIFLKFNLKYISL